MTISIQISALRHGANCRRCIREYLHERVHLYNNFKLLSESIEKLMFQSWRDEALPLTETWLASLIPPKAGTY